MTMHVGADKLTRHLIASEARRWIGTPYIHQASLIGTGCDCLGLVRGVWRSLAGPEPELPGAYTADWAEACGDERLLQAAQRHFTEIGREDWRVGDILLFRWRSDLPAKHLGIAVSQAAMVHAHDGACVCEVPVGSFWRKRVAAAFAFPGLVED